MKPQIIIEDYKGYHHNRSPEEKIIEGAYKDLSTILIVPCLSSIPSRVVQNWMQMMTPMNQKFIRIFAINMEVGHAYSQTIETILGHPDLSKWKYLVTLEHDNIIQPDFLLKMYPDMEEFDAIGSLYYTKGEGGKPMCYGRTDVFPPNFIPFEPMPNAVTPCRGLGMGATMFKLEMFKDTRLPKPLFKTVQEYVPGEGARAYTQDLKFFEEAGKLGYKFGCTTKTLTGHFCNQTDIIW